MSDGGSIVKEIDCHDRKGRSVRTIVIASHGLVEIGGWTFNRESLLRAMGVVEKKHEP